MFYLYNVYCSHYSYDSIGRASSLYWNDYHGSHIIAEGIVSANGEVFEKASYLVYDQIVLREDISGTKSYYTFNGHGDVVELRDEEGVLQNYYEYDMWGYIIDSSETVDNLFKYSGEYWDNSAQLQYLRARWYDPSIGRFITKDTYEGELGNPLSLNLYTYVSNNPLKYIDPSGNAPCYSESSCKQLDEKLGLSSKSVYETPTKRVDEMSPEELWNILNSDYATRDEKAQIMAYIGVHYVLGGGLIGEIKGVFSSFKIGIYTKGASNAFIRGAVDTSELTTKQFKGLKNNGVVKVNSSGSNRPVTGAKNSYYTTANGEHVFVYDGEGKLIYDISKDRVKAFNINVNPSGKEFYQPYKMDGEVPKFIKDMFGW